MLKLFSFKSLKARTVRNKFNLIISLIIFILLFGLVNFWFGTKVLSGIRAYVGGEGLWSKAQKEAVNNLVKYSYSHDESDYRNYQKFTLVQKGDMQARLELNKPHPNIAIVQQGFVQGGNNPKDVNDLIFLYRRFQRVKYMSAAIQIWTQADKEYANQLAVGNQIHELVSTPLKVNTVQARSIQASELSSLLKQTYTTDTKLTVLENQFSATLGTGSRNIAANLIELTIIVTTVLGILTIVIAILIAKAIIRLDKLKTEFVSLASHQLRTPLTTINWYAETLLSESVGKLNEEQKKYLKELYGGAQRMDSLTSDLLKVSSLDLGTYASDIKTINVGETLKTTIKDQQLSIDQKGITLTTNIDPNLPTMQLDEHLLGVVFQNLLSNSVKYTPKGGQININVQSKKPNVLIHISDNGIGIPRSQQSQVFAKLFRADNAQNLSANGTGLGLYIVKAMVQRMGGSIWFDSTENQGTNFYVKIPLYDRHRAKRTGQKNV
ncbi:MAG TPA: HAMP domain-containing sensor histidine kinase [Patescibacteria group bacterium]|nr:HAMP domain-containing sensor histidine kinase [Patescibacteria group bacterium]